MMMVAKHRSTGEGMPKAGRLNLEVRESGNVLIIDLRGRISLGEESGLLRTCLRKNLDENHRRILLTFKDVTYMDSTGIGVLAETKAMSVDLGVQFRLAELPSFVEKLLRNVGLLQFLEVYATEAEALADWQ
jgi:anti-anti-sigma factor